MNMIKASRMLTAITLVGCLSAGCSYTPDRNIGQSTTHSSQFERLVSKDVVSVLRQVDHLAPRSTTLGTADPSLQRGAFAEALKHELLAAGYALRALALGPDTIPVAIQAEKTPNQHASTKSQTSQTVTVTVGDVAVRRTYIADKKGETVPVGRMQVRGFDAGRLRLDNNIFAVPAIEGTPETPPPRAPASVRANQQITKAVGDKPEVMAAIKSEKKNNAEITKNAQMPKKVGLATVGNRADGSPLLDLVAPSVATNRTQSDESTMLSNQDIENVNDLQRSNFQSLFDEMGIVDEKILTFSDDSTFMGRVNKETIRVMLKRFDPKSDVLSVVGCSLGPTDHSGGQEGLARGRAMRVKEELLYSGVPEARIFAEGCWAESPSDESMPRRGVVVTLKRPIS